MAKDWCRKCDDCAVKDGVLTWGDLTLVDESPTPQPQRGKAAMRQAGAVGRFFMIGASYKF